MIRLFRVFIPVGVLTLIISEAILVISCFILAMFLVLEVDPTVALVYDNGLTRVLLVTASILLGMHFNDLYSRILVKSQIGLLLDLCIVMGIAFVAQGFMSYLNRDLRVPIKVMILGGTLSVVSLFVWRVFYGSYMLRVVGAQTFLFLGGSPLIDEIVDHLREHPELGLSSSGYVDDDYEPGTMRNGGKVLGPMSELGSIATQVQPNRIVVAMTERRDRMPVAKLLELRLAGFIIEEVGTAIENVCGRVCTKELRPSQLIFSGELGPRPNSLVFQSMFNLGIALAGTVLSAPLMLISAIAVKLSSPGPILYRQTRVGLDGKPFTVFKFRSMYADAEKRTGAVWATKDDPRITGVGRVLRDLRFDELPQFFNVLRGEMSIVGPRPERPEFVRMLTEKIPYYRQRHCVKPGITGWAQISYKYGDTLEDTVRKLEYDLYYIKNVSLSLDTYIVFHTIKTMLLSRGAQ